jgi:hypothetical protein
MQLSSSPYVLHALPISVILIWTPEWYVVRSTEHKVPRCVVFSTPLLRRLSQVQVSVSAPYSRGNSACVPRPMWATKSVGVKYAHSRKSTDRQTDTINRTHTCRDFTWQRNLAGVFRCTLTIHKENRVKQNVSVGCL